MTRRSSITTRFWQAQLVIWSLYGAVHYMATLPLVEPEDRWGVAGYKALRTLIGLAASVPVPIICRGMLARLHRPWLTIGAAAVAAYALALVWMLVERVADVAIATGGLAGLQIRWRGFPAGVDADAVIALFLSGSVYIALWSWDDAARHRHEALEQQLAAHAARLESLTSLLRPHFVLNALAALRSVIAEDTDRARVMVTQLANFLRITLSAGDSHPLADEISLVQAYLAIERVRFERALAVEVNVDRDTEGCRVPALLLQPLVENALKHGAPDESGVRRLRITAERRDGGLYVEVANTGAFDAGAAGTTGLGMRNTRERLAHVFKDKHRLTITDTNGWVVVRIDIAEAGDVA
jgi:two-component system, LytTR family, sensor kinase